jgi:hypothetical protein
MRTVTTLMSLILASATLGGCAARAGVRVGDTKPASSASKVAADEQTAKPGSSDEAPAANDETKSETGAEPTAVPANN